MQYKISGPLRSVIDLIVNHRRFADCTVKGPCLLKWLPLCLVVAHSPLTLSGGPNQTLKINTGHTSGKLYFSWHWVPLLLNHSQMWDKKKKKVVCFSMTIPIFLLSQDLIYSTNNVSLGKIILNAWDLCSWHPSLSTVVWVQGETWGAHYCRMKEEDRFSNPSLILSASGLGHSLCCKCWGVPGPTVGVLLAHGAQAEASVSCGLTLFLRVLRAS